MSFVERMSMANATANTREQEVTYLSGVDANGNLASPTFETYKGDNPDTYGTDSTQFHWGPLNMAGTAGGTLNYYFAPSANWSAAEQASLASSLDMWSAIANVSFQQTTSAASANVTFERNTRGDAVMNATSQSHPVGTSTITPPNGNNATISLDITNLGEESTATGQHGSLGDFQNGGAGVSTVLHEVGHALGLGHGGPYNGTNTPSQQLGPYDNQISTLMSYFSPNETLAYASPLGATNWTSGGITASPTTWMPIDIDAIQRLYGAQTNGPLNTAQTFGYNTTISGSLKPYFDFTINTRPVLTLYDTAASGNTLDLSQSNQAATLNLNSGAYSSAFGLTNNIAIYDKTYIQRAVSGSGDDVITVNLSKDNTVDGGGGSNTAVFAGNRADYTIAQANGATVVTRIASTDLAAKPTGVTDTLSNIQTLRFDDQAVAVCFCTGTRLRVVRDGAPAEIAVEALQVGDRAVTASGALRPITWIGHRHLDGHGGALPASQQPVGVRADAFAPGLPARDLRLSPGHPVLVGADADGEGGHLVPIMCLINGTSIVREPARAVTYWHVELDGHDILLAEGLAAESYLDWGDRPFFDEASEHALHNPDFIVPGLAARCRPVAVDGPVVEAERARLAAAFATALGADCAWDEGGRFAWLAA